MVTAAASNPCTPSTTWEWKKVKVRRPAGGPSSASSKTASSLSAWNPREPLSITVSYRGGPEAWWLIRARGREFRVPGHLCIHDAMRLVYNHPSLS